MERQVLAHFNGNLVVVPIVYGFERLAASAIQAYGQVKAEYETVDQLLKRPLVMMDSPENECRVLWLG